MVTAKRRSSVAGLSGPGRQEQFRQAFLQPCFYVVDRPSLDIAHEQEQLRAGEPEDAIRGRLRTHVVAQRTVPQKRFCDEHEIAPPPFVEAQIKGIVGIEIPIVRIEGKWKVSQNRSDTDRHGVVEGLRAIGDEESSEMADLVEKRGS